MVAEFLYYFKKRNLNEWVVMDLKFGMRKKSIFILLILFNYPICATRPYYSHLWGINSCIQTFMAIILWQLKLPKKVNISVDELEIFKKNQKSDFKIIEDSVWPQVDLFIRDTMREFNHPCADKTQILLTDSSTFAISAFSNVLFVSQNEAYLLGTILNKRNPSLDDQENLLRIKGFIGHEVGHYMCDDFNEMYYFYKMQALTQMACLVGWTYCFYKVHRSNNAYIKKIAHACYATTLLGSTLGTNAVNSYVAQTIVRKLERNADRYMFEHSPDEKYIEVFQKYFESNVRNDQNDLNNDAKNFPILRLFHRINQSQEPFGTWLSGQTSLKKMAYYARGARHPMDEDRAFAAQKFLLEKKTRELEKMAQDNS